jgi:drug/metabolite transporter (DMT)-like permease
MKKKQFLFSKKRYKILFLSILIIGVGFLLMSGGGSNNPDVFNNEIYNFRRIRLAPLVVISGFIMCIVSILYRDKE